MKMKLAAVLICMVAGGCADPSKEIATQSLKTRDVFREKRDGSALDGRNVQRSAIEIECGQRHLDHVAGRPRGSEPTLIAKQVADERCMEFYDRLMQGRSKS